MRIKAFVVSLLLLAIILVPGACCAQKPVEIYWDGASVNGVEPPPSMNLYYRIDYKNVEDTEWINIYTFEPHLGIGVEHTKSYTLSNYGTFEFRVTSVLEIGIETQEMYCYTNTISYIDFVNGGCGVR